MSLHIAGVFLIETHEDDLCLSAPAVQHAFVGMFADDFDLFAELVAVIVCVLQRIALCSGRARERRAGGHRIGVPPRLPDP